jgi:hypothetical protein
MASGTATVTVDIKLAFAVPMWLRTALIEQGWTPPADPDREQTIPLARGGIIKPGGIVLVGESGPERDDVTADYTTDGFWTPFFSEFRKRIRAMGGLDAVAGR